MEQSINKISINKNFPSSDETVAMFESGPYGNPFQLFFILNKELPSKYNFLDIDKAKLYLNILDEYKINEPDIIISKTFGKETDDTLKTVIIPVSDNLFVYFNPGGYTMEGVEVLYSPSTSREALTKIVELVKKNFIDSSPLGKIHLLQYKEQMGYDLNSYEIKNAPIDISKLYNDDFTEVNKTILNRLNTQNDKGLILLHGKSGTGKTSYIRYLTTQVKKRLIFLSPDLTEKISSPDFLTLLSEYTNSVLIIEDAENVIEARKGGGTSAISNLLNLTDGLLADCLKIQLICSFNTDVTNIDKALLRKGRLITKYEFTELEKSKAQALSDHLGFASIINENTLLTDIFNQNENTHQINKSIKIGFKMEE